LFTTFRDIFTKNSKGLQDSIFRAISYLRELDDKQTGIEYFETLMRYIFNARADLTKADFNAVVKKIETTYPEGSEVVMTLAEIFREEGKEEGIEVGAKQGKIEVAKNAIREGMEPDLVAKLTGLSKKEIEKIAKETEN
jgi:predicted transposase/invertase (TIGR01784 family)